MFRGTAGIGGLFELLPFAERWGCELPIPVAAGSNCIDFGSDPCPPIGDTDGDGYLDAVELRLGSDAEDSDSTPESALLDEQTGSQTCSDRADNDGDGRTDRGDPGCRITCEDFGGRDRCGDDDGDGWLNYVEERYGSESGDAASTPEHILAGETCRDGVDNDGDGDTDGDDDGCGGGEIGDCIDFSEEHPCEPF